MGRAHAFFLDSIDIVARDRMDDIPANNVYVDAFYFDKYHVTNKAMPVRRSNGDQGALALAVPTDPGR